MAKPQPPLNPNVAAMVHASKQPGNPSTDLGRIIIVGLACGWYVAVVLVGWALLH